MKETLSFLTDLKHHNDRVWFAENKERWMAVRADVEALTLRLIAEVARVNPEAARLSSQQCLYRIYRDTRFSHDKTPYKTHIGIFINPPQGKKGLTMGHYLHIEPRKSFYCVGNIGWTSGLLRAVRRSIYDEIDEYRAIVEDPAFSALLPHLGMNPLKTAPKGFPRDWPWLRYIQPRWFSAYSDTLPASLITSSRLPERLRPYIEQGERYAQFINYTVDME